VKIFFVRFDPTALDYLLPANQIEYVFKPLDV
jgi:hypothetical protein